ncbi:MAG: RNA polymerase sigma factor (sigma-70 family) [Mariniblastus sp.]|jgi:RNA polymerase sigma factor (sigma-70 family)
MQLNNGISVCLEQLRDGNPEAAREIWEACYPRLVLLARKRLEGLSRKMKDEEDVALSALKSFFKAAEMGRFPDLRDADDLWRLLCSMTIRKAIDVRRYEGRRPALGESHLGNPNIEKGGLHELPADVDEAAFAERISEELEHRLAELAPDLRELAIAKLEGYSNAEISERLNIALRTVERRLHLIRRKWESAEQL